MGVQSRCRAIPQSSVQGASFGAHSHCRLAEVGWTSCSKLVALVERQLILVCNTTIGCFGWKATDIGLSTWLLFPTTADVCLCRCPFYMLMAVQVNVNSVHYETVRCGNEKVTLAGMNIVSHNHPQLTSCSQTSVDRWRECTLIVMVVKAAYDRILSVIGAKALTYATGHARKKRREIVELSLAAMAVLDD